MGGKRRSAGTDAFPPRSKVNLNAPCTFLFFSFLSLKEVMCGGFFYPIVFNKVLSEPTKKCRN